MTDYYKVLGIDRNASIDQIKQAYRKLAKEHHPDKGGNKEEFLKIQEAYEVLSNPNKNNNQDNINIKVNTGHFPDNFFFSNNFFNFNTNVNKKIIKKDIYYDYNISLKDVYFGTSKKLKLTRKTSCTHCTEYCSNCDGIGSLTINTSNGIFHQTQTKTCSKCNGSCFQIKNNNNNCDVCNLTREIIETKIVDINVLIGIKDKTIYKYNEWGEQAKNKNEIPGNFIVTINITNNENFIRNQNDLIYTTELTLKESLIGKEIIIPHFSGNIELNTIGFGIINPDVQYTIFNKGLRDINNVHGHLHLRFKIKYPEISFNPHQIEILRKALNDISMP